ncbi:MAG: diguanylate cyclase [Firmicutes bacterium]|nr:diguanylate cyclase [Bacillota bacterium]
MSLFKKTSIIICITLTGLISILYLLTQTTFTSNFVEIEERNTRDNAQRVLNAFSDNLTQLNAITRDYAYWNDTYAYIKDGNEGYVNSNFIDETFIGLNLNLIMLLDNSGKIVYGKAFDLVQEEEVPLPDGIDKHLSTGGSLLSSPNSKIKQKGVVQLAKGPMLIASQPILTGQMKGPSRGTLIMGRYLSSDVVSQLASETYLTVNLFNINESNLVRDIKGILPQLSNHSPIFVKPLSKELIAGYALINDIYGNPSLVLKISMPRDVYNEGKESLNYFILLLLVSGLTFGTLTIILLKNWVISRLARLGAYVSKIGAGNDLSARVSIGGKDEVSNLANEINKMLGMLEKANSKMRESEERYRTIFENTGTAIAIIENNGVVSLVNTEAEKMLYYSKIDLEGRFWSEFIVEEDLEKCNKYSYMRKINSGPVLNNFECRIINKQGEIIDTLVTISVIPGTKRILVSLVDITERKQVERKLEYLSLHDSLTGLYNRTFFQQEMQRLKGCHNSLGVILCDLNGLKLVNDTLGHDKGDLLLKEAADIINECSRSSDIVARIGGDEFVVLLSNCDEKLVENTCNRIGEAIKSYNVKNSELHLSISIGFAVSGQESNIDDLFKEADNNMYREKLYHSKSVRSSLVQTLMKALEARDYITEGHASRLNELVVNLARAIGLPEQRMTDLRLLAQFHDIGKVGIPDRILFKEGPLNSEELNIMQRHSDKGYRIAQSAPELIPIADWILKHHEWWNGKGYPLGLKGEEIPLECRILAIADAYDAMTSDRPYRKAMSTEEAVKELKRCAGIQFDPQLVSEFVQLLEVD